MNKVETKVILRWNVKESQILNDIQKRMVLVANKGKLTKSGEVIVTADGERSQLRNKEIAFKKLNKIIAKSFFKKRKRIATKPSRASQAERVKRKKKHSEKKSLRRKIDL